jgi:putative DNA primase/helicase
VDIQRARQLGLSVIPIGADKRPLLSAWKPYQTRTATDTEFAAWVQSNPSAWAIVTGTISRIVTLDFDGQAGAATLESLDLKPHRRTPSGGYHIDFKHPGWRVPTLNSKSKKELGARWPGLDIRADGGYVLFAVRTNKGEYQWLREYGPYDLDVLPESLRDFLGLLKPKPDGPGAPKLVLPRQFHSVRAEILIRLALRKASAEGRNNAGFWLACQLRDNAYSQIEADAVLIDYVKSVAGTNTKGEEEPYQTTEALASVRTAYDRVPREPWRRSVQQSARAREFNGTARPPKPPSLLAYHYNDYGNAKRLIAMYGEILRYCHPSKKWLVFDGRRWAIDETGQARRLAAFTMLEFLRQIVEAGKEDKFARSCLNVQRIKNLLSSAEPEIFVQPEDLDKNPDLLNFLNGTVDLRTGQMHPHRREDFITKLVRHEYHPNAKCPTWLRFLDDVMGGGPDASEGDLERAGRLTDYVQKAIGYSLTGHTIEKAVFVVFGDSDNGKSTMLDTIRQIVEEYAVLLQVDTLMVREESNNTQADLADLRGARFAQTSETEEGQRLAQGKLKRITQGMGKIKAVRKYENPIEFSETHKLWIDTNRKPAIKDADDKATFARLHPIPFSVRIPKDRIDKNMRTKLLSEAEGILAWAVEGVKNWYEHGLSKPPEIDIAREAWRADMDQIGRFIEEQCFHDPNCSVGAECLYAVYKAWAEKSGERLQSAKVFGAKLMDRGIEKTRVSSGIRYHGLSLRDAKENAVEM